MDKVMLLAFVDEIGDRGYTAKSSEYFAMSAIIFPSASQQKVKDCIAGLKGRLGISVKTPLHWRNHCRRHDVRKYVAGEIAKLAGITVIYVISDKKAVPDDQAKFYNTVAAFTLERILKHTEDMDAKVSVRFGHVRGFHHSATLEYFRQRDWQICDYRRLQDDPKWISADSNSGIQLADLYAGILGAAMITDKFGNYENSYLETIKHQIRKSASGKISGYGIKALSAGSNLQSFNWWPEGWA